MASRKELGNIFSYEIDAHLYICNDYIRYSIWEKGFHQDLALNVNAYATKDRLLTITVVIVLTPIQEVIEGNIVILSLHRIE